MEDTQSTRRFLVLALLIVGFILTGCGQPQKLESASSSEPLQPETEPVAIETYRPSEAQRQQAVSLYVDAIMLNELNDYAEAIRKLELATELDPEFALAFSLKGDLYQQQQQFEKSADAYERASTLDPWSLKDFFNLGKVSQILKQFLRAANAYAAASNLDPSHYEAHIGAAQCYFEVKDFEQARQYARKAKQIDPTQAAPEMLMGDIFGEEKEHAEAINAYRRALELQGNQPKVMVALARAYLRTGRFSSAKELLSEVIATEPENALAHQYLGFAQLKLKETQAAVDSYKKAVQLDDGDWMAHKSLGVAYMLLSMQNNNDERIKALAIERWNISLQINPDQAPLRQLLDKYR